PRGDSSLVWGDVSPYNLRHAGIVAYPDGSSQKMTKNVISNLSKRGRKYMTEKSSPVPTTRRRFLRGAALATAATVAAPSVVKAQGPVNMRWQSTWPSKDIFHEYALDYAKKVNDMTG